MTQFIARAYNRFEVDQSRGVISKTSEETRLADEINYYRQLPESLKIWFPRLITCQSVNAPYRLDLELYGYDNLAKPMLDKRFSMETWENVFDRISSLLGAMSESVNLRGNNDHRLAMYVTKTETEYRNLLKNPVFEGMAKHQTISVNQEKYQNFDQVWPKIRNYFHQKLAEDDRPFSIIHGDMCFSNILFGMSGSNIILKFIDPRGSFGLRGCYGDPYYDYAKLAHSIDGGYEFFINDRFNIAHYDDRRSFVMLVGDDSYRSELKERFTDFLAMLDIDMLLVNAIQGAIFIGMCARHYDSLQRQQAMYITGLRLLNQVAEEL